MKFFTSVVVLFLSSHPWGSDACGGTFTDPVGYFTSPNYPGLYGSGQKCVYNIKTRSTVTINCHDFELQKSNRYGVCRDFLKVIDSDTKTTYCSTNGPTNYKSIGTFVRLIFKSNKRRNFSGFNCTYVSTDVETTTTSASASTTTAAATTTATAATTTTAAATTTTTAATTTTASTTTTTTAATTTTTTATTTPDLLQNAINAYSSQTCSTNSQNTCGCSDAEKVSEYYTRVIGDVRIVAATGIPNHIYEVGQVQANPNNACPHKSFMALPANPVKGSTYMTYGMGPVGIAISAGFFYNHLSSPQGDVAVVNEGTSFDTCNGHSDPNCRYHYHLVPKCVAQEDVCTHVGYMRDGFPVYAYCKRENSDTYLLSCYKLTSGDGSHSSHYTYDETAYSNGECDLDQANGYTFSDSRGYAYIFTDDYPFIMAGYYGTELASICYMYD